MKQASSLKKVFNLLAWAKFNFEFIPTQDDDEYYVYGQEGPLNTLRTLQYYTRKPDNIPDRKYGFCRCKTDAVLTTLYVMLPLTITTWGMEHHKSSDCNIITSF